MHFWVCLVIFGGGERGLSVYIVLKACLASGVETLVTAAGPVGEAGVKFPGLGLVFLWFFGSWQGGRADFGVCNSFLVSF